MITTVTLAQGAVRMAREKVIVKHLSAIQNLGSIDILCSDKTGTLTAGDDVARRARSTRSARRADQRAALAHLNSTFETGIKSPLDAAILRARARRHRRVPKTDEIPFDFERRRLSVVVERATGAFSSSPRARRRASSRVLHELRGGRRDPAARCGARERCSRPFRDAEQRRDFGCSRSPIDDVASAGRLHAADERDLTLVGLPRPSPTRRSKASRESIARLRRDGVQVEDPHRRQRARDAPHLRAGRARRRAARPRRRDRAHGRDALGTRRRAHPRLRARLPGAEASHHPRAQGARPRRRLPRRRHQRRAVAARRRRRHLGRRRRRRRARGLGHHPARAPASTCCTPASSPVAGRSGTSSSTC